MQFSDRLTAAQSTCCNDAHIAGYEMYGQAMLELLIQSLQKQQVDRPEMNAVHRKLSSMFKKVRRSRRTIPGADGEDSSIDATIQTLEPPLSPRDEFRTPRSNAQDRQMRDGTSVISVDHF